jgi:hypothetical protein
MDRAEMCGEVLRRTGVKVGEDDPAFLLVEMNRLELEEAVSAVGERLAPLPGTIEKAGWLVAKEVAAAAARVVDMKLAAAREAIAKEADTARAAAARAINELAQEQREAHTDKWITLWISVQLPIRSRRFCCRVFYRTRFQYIRFRALVTTEPRAVQP